MKSAWRVPGVWGEVELTLGADDSSERVGAKLPPRQASRAAAEWFPAAPFGGVARSALWEVCAALGARPASELEALSVLQRALFVGRVAAWRRAPRVIELVPDAPTSPPRPGRASDDDLDAKTWITVRLIDEDDPPRPVAGARYRLRLPDGSLREGSLDRNGMAHLAGIDPGACELSFPDLDAEAWERV